MNIDQLKKQISKYKYLTIVSYIAFNYYQYLKFRFFPTKTTNSARSTSKFNIEEELNKSKEEVKVYTQLASFNKKKVLELGVGAYLSNPLLLAEKKVSKYVGIDLYYCIREPENTNLLREISRKLKEKNPNIKEYFDFKNNKLKKSYFQYLQTDINKFYPDEKFDIILSWATLEHIWDVQSIARSFYRLLEKNGKVISLVGNDDHGMFDKTKYSVYEYYTIPEILYKQMVALSGRPNRYTPDIYIKAFKNAGFKKIKILGYRDFTGNKMGLIDYTKINKSNHEKLLKLLNSQKHKFSNKYKNKKDIEFIPSLFVLVAEK